MANNSTPKLEIHQIDSNSPYLETVVQLADANKRTLGHFPRGAFSRLADKGNILVCVIPNTGCIGYLLYQTGHQRVKLTHLCVNRNWRRKGVARSLIEDLKEKTYYLNGIQASCRRDYGLDSMWQSLGFSVLNERSGRSKEESILTEWWLDYEHPTIFTMMAEQKAESKVCTVIDANVFFDLADEDTTDEYSQESKALMADWLKSQLELCLTNEINNEINRNQDSERRKLLWELTNKFTEIPFSQDKFDIIYKDIRNLFPKNLKDSDASDLRQIAKTLASNIEVTFFVMRDKALIEKIEEDVYKKYGLTILRPTDLIIRLDELRREVEYQPVRLAGTHIQRRRIQSGEQESLITLFLNSPNGEKKSELRSKFHDLLGNPEQFEFFKIGRTNEEPIGLVAYDRTEKRELKVPIFRFRNTQLAPTIVRHCIFECFSTAAKEERLITKINDECLDSLTLDALQEDRFVNSENGWLKLNLPIARHLREISSYIVQICNCLSEENQHFISLAQDLEKLDLQQDCELISRIERILYPLKVTDAEIPTFLIPIREFWAKDLFDRQIAEGYLWGAQEDLAFRRETVYYCSKKGSGRLKAPGRILWYVSKTGNENDLAIVQAIKACSFLDEVVIGKPKELYKQFRRLGVFTWKNVEETARGDLEQEITAIKFSDTELFDYPVTLDDLRAIVDPNIQLRTHRKISAKHFEEIYKKGYNID